MTFIKNKENFICENCGEKAIGNGYTNHCPACLYSKHVDINPGDRQSTCGALMEPVDISVEGQEYSVVHKCVLCKYKKKNKIDKNDDFNKILELVKKRVEGEMGPI